MDWTEQFDREEFHYHLNLIGLGDLDLNTLLKRTTETTRRGNEFSWKPSKLTIGSLVGQDFYKGYSVTVENHGFDILDHNTDRVPSAFWIRFDHTEERFQFRCFAQDVLHHKRRAYEGIIPFKDVISGGVWLKTPRTGSDTKRVATQLTIKTRRPPQLIVRMKTVVSSSKPTFDRQATEADFFRGCEDLCEADSGFISALGDSRSVLKPGIWRTHQFHFELTPKHYKLLWMCLVRLRLIGMRPHFSTPHQLFLDFPLIGLSQQKCYIEHLSLPFSVQYLIEALLSVGTITEPEVGEVLKWLHPHSVETQEAVLEAFYGKTRRKRVAADLERVFNVLEEKPMRRELPSHCMRIRKCLVTPLRLILTPPETETANSVLRRFSKYSDRFLRVQFVGEDGQDVEVSRATVEIDSNYFSKRGVFARIRRALVSGLKLAGREYIYLASSESQARERACWMISEAPGFTREAIFQWSGMKGIDEERIIAKNAARVGLAFSTTRYTTCNMTLAIVSKKEYTYRTNSNVTEEQSSLRKFEIEDPNTGRRIKVEDTDAADGVGVCGLGVIDSCKQALGIRHDIPVSAAHIRIPGIKGMLTYCPALPPNQVVVRDSMRKFAAVHEGLNVIKCSSYNHATLNRQSILLLEGLGVSKAILMELFEEHKDYIMNLQYGKDHLGFASISNFPLRQALKAGFDEDPMVINALRVTQCRLLSDLKWKGWIPVKKGAYLKGVIDDYDVLEEDEIYCQINEDPAIEGPCTIYRNPCLHPGDVRRVTAVKAPALKHLRNVVVFPGKGSPGLANKLFGGDLDGDDYTVIWDPRLLIEQNVEAMDYTPPIPTRSYSVVTIADRRQFFLDYIMNDNLGQICNAHMALADKYGPHDERCKKLAGLASKAVDYFKTGTKVVYDELKWLRAEEWPDFMNKNEGEEQSYKSQKVLGKMFRAIDPDPVFEMYEQPEDYVHDGVANVATSDLYLEETARMKEQYDFELEGLMRNQIVGSEAECLTGLPLRSKKRFRKERDYPRRESLREAFYQLADKFKKEAKEFVETHPHSESTSANKKDDAVHWAAACHKITFLSDLRDRYRSKENEDIPELEADHSDYDAVQEKNLISFPWIFWEDLIRVETASMGERMC